MPSSRWFAVLAGGLLALNACSDSTAPTQAGTFAPVAPATVTLFGVISATGRDPLHGLVLTMDDGTRVPLSLGVETAALASLAGAGVDVRGVWDGDQNFEVAQFIVRQVDGTPVLDGLLAEEQTTEVGGDPVIDYVLRLWDGSAAQLINPAQDMLNHVGARIWVRLDDAGQAREFGIIEKF